MHLIGIKNGFEKNRIKVCLKSKLQFGSRSNAFVKSGRLMGGRACTEGEASLEINVFCKRGLKIVLWEDDDEMTGNATSLCN